MDLPSKVSLVSGAAGGVGQAVVARLARERAAIGLLDVGDAVDEVAAALAAQGARVAAVFAVVASAAEVRCAVAAVGAVGGLPGPVDGLANDAGVTNIVAPLARTTDEQWQRDLGVDLTGTSQLISAVLPAMAQRRCGRIVDVSSMAARGGLWRQAGDSASEAGLLGLTRNVALEHAADGIPCNAVLPGFIETPAVARLPPAATDHAMSLAPVRRTGRPDQGAALVAYLCCDDAACLNGAGSDIDGGSHPWPVVPGSVREVQARCSHRRGTGRTDADPDFGDRR